MKSKLQQFLFLNFVMFTFLSCEERTEWDFGANIKKYVVVEGMITNELKQHRISVCESQIELNAPRVAISNAQVHVLEGNKIREFEENPLGSGIYLSVDTFAGVINKPYVLLIEINQKLYSASAHMIPVTPMVPLTYSLDSVSNLYTVKNVASNFDLNESAMYEIQIDRSHSPVFDEFPENEAHSLLYYYTLQTLDVNEIFAPKKEPVYFPAGTQIVERKYSLAPQYAEFIRSLLSETEWRGGFFDVAHDNVRTNLSDGALGFFAACSVVSDTMVVN